MADGSLARRPRRARSEVFPIFVDSNLDTHLAMVVSSTDTVADFKRNIGIEHALSFPRIGLIDTISLKVKRRGALYHLSESMLVRCAFEGVKGTWFLHADLVATTKMKCKPAKEVNALNQSTELQRSEEEPLVKPSSRLLMGNEDPKQGLTKDDLLLVGNNVADVQTELINSKEDNLLSSFGKEMQPKDSEIQANELATPDAGTNLVGDLEKDVRQEEFGVPSAIVNNLHASTHGRKILFSKKRVKASNHDRKVDENSKHASSIKEKEYNISKKEDGEKRVPEDAVDHNAEGYSEGSLLREDAVKLQCVPALDSIFEKDTDGVAFPEEQSEGAASIKSMPLFTDIGKKRKLKQSSKPQNEVNVAFKKFNRGATENLGGKTEKLEAETAGPFEGKDVEGKLKKVISKQKHLVKDPNTEFSDVTSNMANRSSKKVESDNTRTKKLDVSYNNHGCPANNVMSSNASDKNSSFQTTQVNGHIDDLHKVKSKKLDDAASSKEVDFTMISSETGVEGQINAIFAKKRSKRTSSKKSSGYSAPFNSCELIDEDNTKEATHNKNGYVLKESVAEKNHGEAAISKRYGKVNSVVPFDTNGNDINEKDHSKTEFNLVPSNSFGMTHSLGGEVNKDKLNGKESPGKGHFGEPVAIGTQGAVVSEAPMNIKGKFSRKRKMSVKSGLNNQDFDAQKESPQFQLNEKAERKQKISSYMSHEDLDKESNSTAKRLSGVLGVRLLKPDLATDPSTTSTNSRQDKKKLVKSATSPVITKDLDLPSSPDNQASVKNLSRPTNEKSGSNAVQVTSTSTPTSISPENDNQDINKDLSNVQTNTVKDYCQNTPSNFSTGSFEDNNRNELDKSDNGKIDFIGFFSTEPDWHDNILSTTNLASSEIESGKQHTDNNKKKKKSSSTTKESHIMEINPKNFNHSNSNLVDPEKGPNGLVVTENESLHDVTVEKTSMTNVNHIVSSGLLLSSQSPHARMFKERTQNCISDHDKPIPLARSDQSDKASLHRPKAKSSRTQGANGIEKSKSKVKLTGKSNGNTRTDEIPKDQILSNSVVHASNIEAHANQEASSNSTEQETPIQAKRYRIAVRKAPKKSANKAFKISDEENISFAPSVSTSDSTSGISEDESDISNRETTRRLESDGSHQSTDSDKDLGDDAGSVTPSFVGKNERTDDGDVILSQASNISMKGIRIGTIFRSTSSYKKAKLRASQSQAEDLDSQHDNAGY